MSLQSQGHATQTAKRESSTITTGKAVEETIQEVRWISGNTNTIYVTFLNGKARCKSEAGFSNELSSRIERMAVEEIDAGEMSRRIAAHSPVA